MDFGIAGSRLPVDVSSSSPPRLPVDAPIIASVESSNRPGSSWYATYLPEDLVKELKQRAVVPSCSDLSERDHILSAALFDPRYGCARSGRLVAPHFYVWHEP